MQAGYLYEPIVIQQKSVARDTDYGGEAVSWTTFHSCRANCTDLSGAEAVSQGLRVGERAIKVTIRYRTGITTAMRVQQNDGRFFQIVAAVEIPRKRGLDLHCVEYTSPQ